MCEENIKLNKIKRLPIALQIIICLTIFLVFTLYCILWVGEEEYNQQFCEEVLGELPKGIKKGLLEDYVTKTYPPTDKIKYGCCKIDEDGEINIKKDCIYTPQYKKPSYSNKISSFFKKF